MLTANVAPIIRNVVRPRSNCSGGASQLKLGHKTKPPLTLKEKNERATKRVKDKIGNDLAQQLLEKWKEIKKDKNLVKRQFEGDGVIRNLKTSGLSDIELISFLKSRLM